MKSKHTKSGRGSENNGVKSVGWFRLAWLAGLLASGGLMLYSSFATAPPPGLTIAPLGTNTFSIVITNSLSTTNYELYWTPALGDPENPWTLIGVGTLGQSNFVVNADSWPMGFFEMSLEQVYNGIPDYELADPNNPSLGILSITIDSPTNGTTFN